MKKITLILLTLVMIVTLAACGDKCDHAYDNACDATCNECGETREVGAHDFADADCDTPKTCKVCGKTEGEALGHDYEAADCLNPKTCKTCGATDGAALGHTPAEDDGDCTTEVKCTVCGEVTTAAKTEHIAHADDGDCTTPVTCTECATVLTAAKSHDFTGDYESNETQHWHVCKNEGCNVTDEKIDHTPNQDAATVTAPKKCTVCEHIIEPQLPHDHVAGEDDGNCTTAIGCVNCGQTAVAAYDTHKDIDHDYDCDIPAVRSPLRARPRTIMKASTCPSI